MPVRRCPDLATRAANDDPGRRNKQRYGQQAEERRLGFADPVEVAGQHLGLDLR